MCANKLTREVAQGDTRLVRARKRRVIYQARILRIIQGTDEIGDGGTRKDALMGGVNGVFSSSFC
jgi:hypothetical protein